MSPDMETKSISLVSKIINLTLKSKKQSWWDIFFLLHSLVVLMLTFYFNITPVLNDPSLKTENMPNVISTSFYTFHTVPPHGSLKLKHTAVKMHQSIINTCWWDGVYNISPGTCNGKWPLEITVKCFISCMMIWTHLHLSNYWRGCSIVLYRVWITVNMLKMMFCQNMYCRRSTGGPTW